MPNNTPKWSPGPWKHNPIPGYQYVVEIDKKAQVLLVAAAVPPGREAEVLANATLAAAAPELYDALLETQECLLLSSQLPRTVIKARLQKNAELLVKARGEQTDGK